MQNILVILWKSLLWWSWHVCIWQIITYMISGEVWILRVSEMIHCWTFNEELILMVVVVWCKAVLIMTLQEGDQVLFLCYCFPFYPLAFQAEMLFSLPTSDCLSIWLSLCKPYLVRTITCHRFELESSNLHQTCIMGYSQSVLKMEVIHLDLQGNFGHFDLEF